MKIGVNNDLCSGCRVCELVCALRNFNENNPKKGMVRIKGHFPAPGKYEIQYCNQCGECFNVCPVGAIKEEDGHYRVEPDECTGCLLCVETCPRHVMFTHADFPAPFKCVLCGDCLRHCPTNALFDADGEVPKR
ncbi:MAG: 4Fe-4S binding protein [Firmicutes bacterium]|nr:4Fe-4S binding protein [Bacillota bacterium]